MRDLVQDFLERMDPRSPQERAEVSGRRVVPPQESPVAPDPAPDAPTDREYMAAWQESVMPDFDVWDGSCGCGEQECAGAC